GREDLDQARVEMQRRCHGGDLEVARAELGPRSIAEKVDDAPVSDGYALGTARRTRRVDDTRHGVSSGVRGKLRLCLPRAPSFDWVANGGGRFGPSGPPGRLRVLAQEVNHREQPEPTALQRPLRRAADDDMLDAGIVEDDLDPRGRRVHGKRNVGGTDLPDAE